MGERQGGEHPPGVTDHYRPLDVETREGVAEKIGLRRGGPRPRDVVGRYSRSRDGRRR